MKLGKTVREQQVELRSAEGVEERFVFRVGRQAEESARRREGRGDRRMLGRPGGQPVGDMRPHALDGAQIGERADRARRRGSGANG